MRDEPDFDIFKPSDPSPVQMQTPSRRGAAIGAIAALVVVVAVVAYIFVQRRPAVAEQKPATAVQPTQVPQEAPASLGGDPAPIELPPLDQTDQLVRDLVKHLSSHPTLAAWLATDGLIRNFTVAMVNVAEGKTPAGHLRVLRPSSSFRVVERAGDLYVDPRSYRRYDGIAAAAASIDPVGAARLYATLKPRIEDAHRELGFPDVPVDRTLERAIVVLLGTPALDSPRVEPRGVGYEFADPRVEQLPAAQKQFLRMGGENVRTIQAALREIALALGIPSDRLPAPAR